VLAEYRTELIANVVGARKTKWFPKAAKVWLQWTEHADFPRKGTAAEKIWFAIQRHCEANRCKRVFLSARDAASIAGIGRTAASVALWELCRAKRIRRTGNRIGRLAQEFRLEDVKKRRLK
jgi:hypothetical protein